MYPQLPTYLFYGGLEKIIQYKYHQILPLNKSSEILSNHLDNDNGIDNNAFSHTSLHYLQTNPSHTE